MHEQKSVIRQDDRHRNDRANIILNAFSNGQVFTSPFGNMTKVLGIYTSSVQHRLLDSIATSLDRNC